MSETPPSSRSDAFVFFGASGDLAYKKIFPALYAMERRGHLDLPVIGVARSEWRLEEFRARARESVQKHVDKVDDAVLVRLLERLRYVLGDYADPATFKTLRAELGQAEHPAHYLAVPPSMFGKVVEGLGASGCAKGGRLIVDSVQITMAEKFGVEGRGSFYEEAGAIRDVVQNHLLQVIGFLAMEPPVATYHDAIRDEQVKVFRAIRPLNRDDLVRGQFTGYRAENGVAPDSTVETFAAVRLHVDSWRWDGVPFFIRAGKCLPVSTTEVLVTLKPPPLRRLGPEETNYLRFRLSPDVTIAVGARVKKPGEQMVSEPTELRVVHHPDGDEMDAYERLIGDAMAGDATLFARQDAVDAAWAIVQPILDVATPVHEYAPGTWGPPDAARLTADVGG